MMNDDRYRYRWQDQVIALDHLRVNLVASGLVIAIVCSALVSGFGAANIASPAAALPPMGTTFSLAHVTKPPVYPRHTENRT